ncbi:MAG: PorV/PorQ family protein [FCB group bacterium]|nr:PorV/PorQ family protein [FCB group bacterium]
MRQSKLNTLGLIAVLIVTFWTGVVEGGSKARRGTAGAQELLIPVGSRGTAMAGAYLAGLSGVEAAEWNVAGLARIKGNGEAMFSRSQWLGDINVNYGVVAAAAGRNYFGLSLKSLDFGDIPITTVLQPDGTGGKYSPSFITLGFLYSRRMTDRIMFGTGVKFVSETIMREQATGMALDAGVQYQSSSSGIQIGASIRNLGMSMLFSGSDLEEFHQPDGTEPGTPAEPRQIRSSNFELPTTFELGIAYGPVDMGPAKATIAASFLNNNFSFDEYRFGGEANVLDILYLRGGMTIGYDPEAYGPDGIKGTKDDSQDEVYEWSTEEFIWGPTFGFGLDLAKITGIGLSVDYSYRTAKFFKGVNWLSIKIAF